MLDGSLARKASTVRQGAVLLADGKSAARTVTVPAVEQPLSI